MSEMLSPETLAYLGIAGEEVSIAREQTLREIEADLRHLNHEKSYIVGVAGTVREETSGGEREVPMDWASMRAGEISIHNHVRSDWSPPSYRDWEMMLAYPVGEMRVVSENWTYVLRPPADGWPLHYRFRRYWTGEKMRFGLNLKEMVEAVGGRIESILPHWYDQERRREEGSELLHKAWSAIAGEVGAEYWREPAWEKLGLQGDLGTPAQL